LNYSVCKHLNSEEVIYIGTCSSSYRLNATPMTLNGLTGQYYMGHRAEIPSTTIRCTYGSWWPCRGDKKLYYQGCQSESQVLNLRYLLL